VPGAFHEHVGEAAHTARVLIAEFAPLCNQTRHDSGITVYAYFQVIEPERLDPERSLLKVSQSHWLGYERAVGICDDPVIAQTTAPGSYIAFKERVAPVMLDLDNGVFDRVDARGGCVRGFIRVRNLSLRKLRRQDRANCEQHVFHRVWLAA